jgi:hypothetical protein
MPTDIVIWHENEDATNAEPLTWVGEDCIGPTFRLWPDVKWLMVVEEAMQDG